MLPIRGSLNFFRLGLLRELIPKLSPVLPTTLLGSTRSFSFNSNATPIVRGTGEPSKCRPSLPALTSLGASSLLSDFTSPVWNSVRTNIFNKFPRPRENKRRKHCWETRMKSETGRRIIMRRILKGRFSLCHDAMKQQIERGSGFVYVK